MEQAIRGVQRHRQQAAVVQPAPRRVPGRAAQRLFRHSGAGAAVLPLPHERLREQHPGHWHRRTVRCFHRSCRAGLPALCGADCRWHRGTYHMEQPVRQGVHSADIRAGGHPETPALPRYPAHSGVFRQCSALLQPAFAAHCLLLYQRGEPAPLRPVHRRDCRRHPQRTGAAGPAGDRHCGCRHMDSCGSAEPAARRRNAQPRPQHRAWPGLPGPGHRRGQRGAGRGAGGDMAERAFLPVLHRGLCDREPPLRPGRDCRRPAGTAAGRAAGDRHSWTAEHGPRCRPRAAHTAARRNERWHDF